MRANTQKWAVVTGAILIAIGVILVLFSTSRQDQIVNVDPLLDATLEPLRSTNTSLEATVSAIETAQPYILQTAEAKGREEVIREININTVVLSDEFDVERDDGLGLPVATNGVSYTTRISGGHYVIEANTEGTMRFLDIATTRTIKDFELILDIAEVSEDYYIDLIFRRTPALFQDEEGNLRDVRSGFGVFSESGNLAYVYSRPGFETVRKTLQYNALRSIRIICKDKQCQYFINNNEQPFEAVTNLLDVSGSFILGFSGTGVLRIDRILINDLQ